jgi:hypothetical protein
LKQTGAESSMVSDQLSEIAGQLNPGLLVLMAK